MYSLSGFITMPNFFDNTVGKTSVIGELSQSSGSYTRELGLYGNQAQPDVKLLSFNSTNDDVLVIVPQDVQNLVLRLGQWFYQNSVNGTLTSDHTVALQTLTASFGSEINVVSLGKMVTNGNYWLPENIRFSIFALDTNVIRLWFSDPAFAKQYDLYEMFVIPPVPNIDDLMGPKDAVIALINSINVPDQFAKASALRGKIGETDIIATNYDFVWQDGSGLIMALPWGAIFWGEAGRSVDVVQDNIVDYIREHSRFPIDIWEPWLPDLLTPTEFVIAPYWEQYAVPNMSLKAGIYSPTVKHKDAVKHVSDLLTTYTEEHIRDCLCVAGSIYKSLAFGVVGNIRNRHASIHFDEAQPEYFIVSTTSNDFSRLSPDGQAFVTLLMNLFVEAEKADQFSELPAGITRTTRDGVLYICAELKKVRYLVVAKSHYFPTGE